MKTWNTEKHCIEERKDIEPFIEEYRLLCRKYKMQLEAWEELSIGVLNEHYLKFDEVPVNFEERSNK